MSSSSTPYMPLDSLLHIQIGQQDLGLLLLMTVTGTCGGRSFRVQWAIDQCTRFAPYLSQHDRMLIAQYIQDQRKHGLGDHHDADQWLELMRYLQTLKNVVVKQPTSMLHTDDEEAIPNQATNTSADSE